MKYMEVVEGLTEFKRLEIIEGIEESEKYLQDEEVIIFVINKDINTDLFLYFW